MKRNWKVNVTTGIGTQINYPITLKSLKKTIDDFKTRKNLMLLPGFTNPVLPWLITNVVEGTLTTDNIKDIIIDVSVLNKEK